MSTLKERLKQFEKDGKFSKLTFVKEIFDLADNKSISKLDAVLLLERYELLPIGESINDMPKFIRDTFKVDYEGSRSRSAIFYFSDELEDEMFYDKEEEIEDWTPLHPGMTIEEGIDLIYEYVKDNRIIGTKIDW